MATAAGCGRATPRQEPDPLACCWRRSAGGDEADEPPLLRRRWSGSRWARWSCWPGSRRGSQWSPAAGRPSAVQPVARFEATPPAPPPRTGDRAPVDRDAGPVLGADRGTRIRGHGGRVAALRRAEPGWVLRRRRTSRASSTTGSWPAGRGPAGAGTHAAARGGGPRPGRGVALAPTRWAFYLGDFDAQRGARPGRRARCRGHPHYVVEIPYEHGPSRYRLYANIGPRVRPVLEDMLRRAGYEPQLVERKGRPAL